MQLDSSVRRNLLLILTGLIVAYVRNFLQYHRYSFESVWELLGFWFAHYVVIAIVSAIAYGLIHLADRFILVKEKGAKRLSVDEAIVYFCVLFIVSSAVVFVVAHWPAGLSETLDE